MYTAESDVVATACDPPGAIISPTICWTASGNQLTCIVHMSYRMTTELRHIRLRPTSMPVGLTARSSAARGSSAL